jgi:S1-C subfamily serine protease
MKKIIILLTISLAAYNSVEAQTRKVKTKSVNGQTTKVREQVVDPGTSEKTIVEVRDGRVLVNGEAVSDNPNTKVIVKNNNRRSSVPAVVTVNKREVRPRLGIYAVDDEQGGALVANVDADGPAAEVGIRSGDVIVKINNTLIGNASELASVVAAQRNGEELIIYYDRDDRPLRSTVLLDRPMSSGTADAPSFSSSSTYTGELPRSYMYNDEHLNMPDAHPLGIRGSEVDLGIRVLDVAEGSAAHRAGLLPGDIITRIDGSRVLNAGDIGRLLRHSNNLVPLDFLRSGERRHTVLRY